MKYQLSFTHFNPSPADRQTFSNQLSMIQDLAPADSTVCMIISKLADGTYHTIIDIKAFCGKFYSEAKEMTSLASMKSAKHHVLSEILDWKRLRF